VRKIALLAPTFLAISILPAIASDPPKAGATCAKQAISKTYKSKKFTCVKAGKKLVWNKGVSIRKTKPTPTPSRTPTPTQTPIASSTSFEEGLLVSEYLGYFGNDIKFSDAANYVGTTKVTSSLSELKFRDTGSTFIATGFFKPNQTGTWEFELKSSGASYLWLGNQAVEGFTKDNTVAVIHAYFLPKSNSGRVWLNANQIYPMRIMFGLGNSNGDTNLKITSPSGLTYQTLNSLVSHNPLANNPRKGFLDTVYDRVKNEKLSLRKPAIQSTQFPETSNNSQQQPNNIENCKLPRPADLPVDVGTYGFPRGQYFLPSQGTFEALIIPVEFSDAKAINSPKIHMENYTKKFDEFYESMSRGKVRFNFTIMQNWIAMPKKASDYAGAWPHNPEAWDYVRAVFKQVDSEIDFSKFKIVYIIPVDGAQNFFESGPVMSSGRLEVFFTDEGPVNNVVFGSYPWRTITKLEQIDTHWKWRWLAHETGHLFGIPHPHDYTDNDKRNMSIFSLMDIGYFAPGFYGWERWLLDWIPSTSIECIDARNKAIPTKIHKVSPLGSGAGSELIVYRISERKAIAVENRQTNSIDSLPSDYEGVLVYEIDSSKPSESIKPILNSDYQFDQSIPESNGGRVIGTLISGEFVEYMGIKIEVIAKIDQEYLVRITTK
jgi:M6 family metalloprotease-like protein